MECVVELGMRNARNVDDFLSGFSAGIAVFNLKRQK
jgi:hypothetical protein